MNKVTLFLEPTLIMFYTKIANAAGIPVETVLADALFKLAAELSLESLQRKISEPFS